MTQERHERLGRLFLEASKRPEAEQRAYLEEHCADDDAMLEELLKMLRSDSTTHRTIGAALEGGHGAAALARGLVREGAPEIAGEFKAGDEIGPYTILERLGEGGFAVVYLAQQDEPVRRRVALKVLKPGMDSRQVLARFGAERQALAMMDHEHVATIHDAGTLESGRPFFVMEHVKGKPITEYCTNRKSSLSDRLDLIMQACAAVQHAHQKGIIHRDLKPSNVLVSDTDAGPSVKVIDFGVAKAISQPLTEETIFTEQGQLVGTPEYMSPEQADLNATDIDTRTDVYALGILLYELLAGVPPFDLKQAAFYEIQRTLREVDPPKPSTRISAIGPEGLSASTSGITSDSKLLARLLRGDLDWIVMKALEKDRNRRYDTANGLAADLQRYLVDEPVSAGPPSAIYRARKLIKRNKGLFAAVAIITVLLIGGVTGTTIGLISSIRANAALDVALESEAQQRRSAEENARRAARRAAEATAVNVFLIEDLLGQARPEVNPVADNITVRALLDRSAEKIEGSFEGQEGVEVTIRNTIADAYFALGLYQDAETHWRRSVDLLVGLEGDDDPHTLEAMDQLAMTLDYLGRSQEAESMYRRILNGWQNALGADSAETMLTVNNLAESIRSQGRYVEASRLHEENLEKRRSILGDEHPDTLETMNNLAAMYYRLSDLERSEAMFEETWIGRRQALGDEHPLTLITMSNLAVVRKKLGKLAEAEPLLRRSLEADRRIQGAEHPDTLTDMHNLGQLLLAQQKCDEAEPLISETLALRRRILGESHPHTLSTMQGLIDALQCLGNAADARELLVELIGFRRHVADEPEATPRELHSAANVLLTCEPDDLRDADGALTYARRACEQTAHENVRYLQSLAHASHETGRRDEAIRWQTRAIELTPEDDPDRRAMQQRLEQYRNVEED
ncbi:MAG: serine/threonine-protein kinase [Planctomycetota bacterium]|nr:serine/threonine-protein kinase [Planctomycetota bacterium]